MGPKLIVKILKVILNDEEGREVCFYVERDKELYPLISAMKASELLCQGCIRY